MHRNINIGDRVMWDVGVRHVRGRVVDSFVHKSHGHIPSKNSNGVAELEDQALVIELDDGRRVLKLANEVHILRG